MALHELPQAQQDALVELVSSAMKSGWWCAQENADAMRAHHDANPNCSGSDMLDAALGDFPRSFLETRRDLVEGVFA